MMTLVIALFKAKESLLSIGIVIIVMYPRDVRIINLVRHSKALFYESNSSVAGWVTLSTS